MLLFLLVAKHRLHYPFELDRMESAMMTSVWRVAHGLPLYGKPSINWAPFLYAPVFFYVSAAVAKVVGLGYAALRIVSIAATVGSAAVIYALVLRETRRHAAALVACGLYVGLYSAVLGWYDVGRVDSLSVFFFLVAIYCTRWTHPLVAALAWLLAFQTKQSILPIALLVFAAEWQRPRRMLLGMGAFAALAMGSVTLLNRVTAGWYSFYVFGASRQIAFQPRLAAMYIPQDLLAPLGIALALIGAALFLAPPTWRGRASSFYAIVSFLIVGGVGFVRAHEGANVNALMPVYAWIAVLFGIAIHRLLQLAENSGVALAASVVWLFAAMQLGAHVYQPGRFKISADTLRYRTQFLDALRATPGDVWVVNHSYDSILAGKQPHAEMDALDSVLGRPYQPTIDEVQQDYAAGRFTAVVLDRGPETYSPGWLFNGPLFRAQYGLQIQAPGADQPMVADQPQFVFLPCVALQRPPVLGLQSAVVNGKNCAGNK